MKHPYRTGLTAAVGAALCLPMLAVTTAATAHEGHDDTAPPRPPSRSRRSPSTTAGRAHRPRRAARRRRPAHHARRRHLAQRRRDRRQQRRRPDPGLPPRRGGPPEHRARPGLRRQKNSWIYLYYSPPLDTPADDPATPRSTRATPRARHGGRLRALQGLTCGSRRFKLRRRPVDLGSEQKVSTSRSTAASAATSAATSSSTPTGNLIPVHRRRHQPVPVRRLHPDRRAARPQPGVRRPAHRGQHQRPARQDPADHAHRRRRLHDPRGQPVRAGHARKTRPEIYVMGLRNPFRIEIDPDTDDLYVADYSPDARAANPARGPAGHGKWAVVRRARQLRLALLRHRRAALRRLRLRHRHDRHAVRLRRPGQRLAAQHRPARAARRWTQPRGLVLVRRSRREFPGARGRGGIGPMAGPAYQFDTKAARDATPSPGRERYDGHPAVLRVDPRLHQGRSTLDGGDGSTRSRTSSTTLVDRQPDGHGVRPRRRALRPGVRRRLLRREPGRAALPHRLRRRGRQPQPGPGASRRQPTGGAPLTVAFSSAGTTDPDGDRLRYAWDFDGDGKVDSTRPNPAATPTREDGTLPRHAAR